MIDLTAFDDICRAIVVDGYGPVFALFVAGLAGGLTHCAGMCGPLALGQASARAVPLHRRWARLGHAVLAPYHLGRMATYATLGALAASGTGLVGRFADVAIVAVPLLLLAAALLLVQAGGATGDTALGRLIGRLTPSLARDRTFAGRLVLGALLGLLPCGLVYAALAGAAATASPALGALAMASFALGTAPALVVVAYAGHGLALRLGAPLRAVAIGLLIVNAGTVGLIALVAAP